MYRARSYSLLVLLALIGVGSVSTADSPSADGLRWPFGDPRARSHGTRSRSYDLQHVKVELRFDWERREVLGTATLTLAPLNQGLRTVVLDAAELSIESVELEERSLPFVHSGDQLSIALDHADASGAPLSLVLRYRARPRKGLYFVKPDAAYPNRPRQLWTQGETEDNRYWIPLYDFPNDKVTSELLVTVPSSMIAISNGTLVAVREDRTAQTKRFHWRQDQPHSTYLISLVVGTFDHHSGSATGIPLEFYVPPGTDAATVARSFSETGAMLEWFSHTIGIPYPFKKYAQTTVLDFLWGGMENTSATTLYTDTLHDQAATPNWTSESLVAHELAHQWWGNLLTCRDWSEIWLNEGFATFFTDLWFEQRYGRDEYDYQRGKHAEDYFKEDREKYRRPIVYSVYLNEIDLFDRHSYPKGALVLDMLRFVLEDALFQKAIRHYAKKFSYQSVDTDDFRKAIAEATGQELDWFFQQWLYAAGHPEFHLQAEWEESTHTLHLIVEQRQARAEMTPLFRMPVDVEFTAAEGVQHFRVEVAHSRDDFYFTLPSRPTRIRFDPGQRILKKLEFVRSRDELVDLLRNDSNVLGRIWAAEQLARRGNDAVALDALRDALLQDPFYGVRAEVARALGQNRSPGARDALLQGLTETDPRVREAAVKALGEFLGDEKAAGALDQVIRGDPKTYVVAEAVRARGQGRAPGAFEALRAVLGRPSHVEIITRKAFEGLGELGDPRAIPLALEWSRYGRPPRAREEAILALGKLGKGNKQVFAHLQGLLADPYLWARSKACEALGELGDPNALPALEAAAAGEAERRVQREAERAINRIRRGEVSPSSAQAP